MHAAWLTLPDTARPTLWHYALPRDSRGSVSDRYLPPNHTEDVSAFVTAKLRAMGCHRSLGLPLANTLRRFPERVTHEPFHVAELPTGAR